MRIDLQDGAGSERWLVVIQDGSVSISHRNAKADCIIRTSKQVFEGLVTGNINAMAATLRGLLVVEGDPNFLVLIQRAFPSPPKTRSERVTSAKSPTS